MLDVLRRIPGVGRVSNAVAVITVCKSGFIRIVWQTGVDSKGLAECPERTNSESAAGELGKQPVLDVDITLPVTARGRLSTVKEFEDIVVRANPDGSIVRIRDVARVSLEASSYSTESGLNEKMRLYLLSICYREPMHWR